MTAARVGLPGATAWRTFPRPSVRAASRRADRRRPGHRSAANDRRRRSSAVAADAPGPVRAGHPDSPAAVAVATTTMPRTARCAGEVDAERHLFARRSSDRISRPSVAGAGHRPARAKRPAGPPLRPRLSGRGRSMRGKRTATPTYDAANMPSNPSSKTECRGDMRCGELLDRGRAAHRPPGPRHRSASRPWRTAPAGARCRAGHPRAKV